MNTANYIARLATLKRNTTVLEQTAPASAGGVSASVIDNHVQLAVWTKEHEIDIDLTAKELFDLRYFLNAVADAVLNGADYPETFFGSRK